MKESDLTIADIIIVGGGLSGMLLAHVLAKQEINVVVVERNQIYPDNFRAEKLEPNQWAYIKKFGLNELILPADEATGKIVTYDAGCMSTSDGSQQFGFRYNQTVNNLRNQLPENINLVNGTVYSVGYENKLGFVHLVEGKKFSARLIVLAMGGVQKLPLSLGLDYYRDCCLRSLSFGFDISPCAKFKYRGFTYICQEKGLGVDYVTCFMIGSVMRVNVFSQWHPKEEKVKLFRQQPKQELMRYFPELEMKLGCFDISSKVQVFPTEYYRMRKIRKNGVVVIADEFQSVSPTTGTGLTKVTVEVDVLSRLIPGWLETPAMPWSKVRNFYNNIEKVNADFESWSSWIYYANPIVNKSYSRAKYRILSLRFFWRSYLNRLIKLVRKQVGPG